MTTNERRLSAVRGGALTQCIGLARSGAWLTTGDMERLLGSLGELERGDDRLYRVVTNGGAVVTAARSGGLWKLTLSASLI